MSMNTICMILYSKDTPRLEKFAPASHFTHTRKNSFNYPPSKNVDFSILFTYSLYIQKMPIYQRFFNIDEILLVSIKNKCVLPIDTHSTKIK